jgi:hypothetical protein
MNFISIYSLVVEKADDYFLFGTQKKWPNPEPDAKSEKDS